MAPGLSDSNWQPSVLKQRDWALGSCRLTDYPPAQRPSLRAALRKKKKKDIETDGPCTPGGLLSIRWTRRAWGGGGLGLGERHEEARPPKCDVAVGEGLGHAPTGHTAQTDLSPHQWDMCPPVPSGPPPPVGHSVGCCFFTGPWTVTRSALRMLRWVAAFCRPLRPVLLPVSLPRWRSPVDGVLGLWWLRRDVPFVR